MKLIREKEERKMKCKVETFEFKHHFSQKKKATFVIESLEYVMLQSVKSDTFDCPFILNILFGTKKELFTVVRENATESQKLNKLN